MEVEDELKFDFDPLDASKIFPEDQFPLQPVGRMVLDRNIDNFFNEQEMVAFNPGVTPPGLLLLPEHMDTAYPNMLASPHPRCILPPPPPPSPPPPPQKPPSAFLAWLMQSFDMCILYTWVCSVPSAVLSLPSCLL